MRAAEHILGGVITTTITYLAVSAILREPVTFEGLVVAGLVGVPAGLLLDWIETPPIIPTIAGLPTAP